MRIISNSRYPAGYDGVSVAGGIEIQDFVQSGYFALVSAVKHYDPERGSFLTLLGFYLKKEFYRTQGVDRNRNTPRFLDRCCSIDVPVGEDKNDPRDIADPLDVIEQIEDSVYNEQLSKALDNAMKKISKRQEDCIRRYYLKGESQIDIAKDYGLSPPGVSSSIKAALKELRENKKNGLEEFLTGEINYYYHVSPEEFCTTRVSSTEKLAFDRMRLAEEYRKNKSG